MAGCKRCALKEGKREREKEEKRKGKRRKKWGSKSFFFFFYKSTCSFFHMRSGHFSNMWLETHCPGILVTPRLF